MKVKCKICKKPVFGRSDKVYCSIYCKNQFHISQKQKRRILAAKIDGQLHNNYDILSQVLGRSKDKVSVPRKVLEEKSFSFVYHTHQKVKRQKPTYFIYDLAWKEARNGKIEVLKS